MKPLNKSAAWVMLGLLSVVFLTIATFDNSGPLEGEDRVQYLTTIYACPQCDGQSVSESNAAVATTIRDFIRVKVASGATDREIRDELIQAYSTDVLLTPPAEGISLLIWILPVAVFVGGGAFVVSILMRRTNGVRSATQEDAALVAEAQRTQSAGNDPGRSPAPSSEPGSIGQSGEMDKSL